LFKAKDATAADLYRNASFLFNNDNSMLIENTGSNVGGLLLDSRDKQLGVSQKM